MYYIVYDNETKDIYSMVKMKENVQREISSGSDGGISTSLIVIILIGVIAILAVVVVVISRRDRDDFDDEFETDYEEDKSYASIRHRLRHTQHQQLQSPRNGRSIREVTFWTQEDSRLFRPRMGVNNWKNG